ncbi:MAG: hypothetical protein RLZZ196_2852 [Bacteroidota bacterium]|jgi:hypothetical protein
MEQNIEKQVTRGLGNTQPETQYQPQMQSAPKSYPFPTEIISLPSKGLCYPESNPLSKGELTVKLMTAKEEDILTSTALIRKGIQLDKLLESIVVEPGVNINDLLIGDKNAILVTSRILAFGPEYNVKINDPFENDEVETTIDLSTIKLKEIDESKLNRENEYAFTLPVSKSQIKFKLLTHGDELAINRDMEASQKTLKQSNEITTRYRRIIVEVDGNRDLGYISNFVANRLLAGDSKALRKFISTISPDLDLTFDYTSPVTGETEALKIPFGIGFFYPAD